MTERKASLERMQTSGWAVKEAGVGAEVEVGLGVGPLPFFARPCQNIRGNRSRPGLTWFAGSSGPARSRSQGRSCTISWWSPVGL